MIASGYTNPIDEKTNNAFKDINSSDNQTEMFFKELFNSKVEFSCSIHWNMVSIV